MGIGSTAMGGSSGSTMGSEGSIIGRGSITGSSG